MGVGVRPRLVHSGCECTCPGHQIQRRPVLYAAPAIIMAGVIVCVTMFMASTTTIIIIIIIIIMTTTMALSGGDDGEGIYLFALLEV